MVSQTESIDVPPWLEDHCIGGHPALDFINTNSHRLDPQSSVDRFNTVGKILSWLEYQSLIPAGQMRQINRENRSELDQQLVKTVRRLRKQVEKAFDALADGQQIPPDSFASILQASSSRQIQMLNAEIDTTEPNKFEIKQINTNSICALLALLAVDAILKLPKDRIRSCPRCGWLFFDRSKGGRRKWCDMKACGNREKVARHYHSHKR